MIPEKFKNDLKVSVRVVWLIVSVILLSVIVMSVYFPGLLINSAPVCLSKVTYNSECFMCGMTRAFIEIPAGNLSGALELNTFSITLYFIFVLNSAAFIIYLSKKAKELFYISKNQYTH